MTYLTLWLFIKERNKNIPQLTKKIGVGFGVLFLRDGSVLLGKRHADPAKADSELHGAGTWTMPGGKLDFGETFENGAKREVKEETGIELVEVKPLCVNNDRVEDAHFITLGMQAVKWEGEAQALEPDEIIEWRWFALDSLPEPLYFPSAEILENYRRKEFYIKGQ